MPKSPVLLLVAAVLILNSPGYTLDVDSLFLQANKHFEDKDYSLALNDYLGLEETGYVSASLYFNIGNCYFKEGKLGYAVLYYLRARRLSPNDEDINANLAFARQFMPTRLEGVEVNPITAFLGTVVAPFTLEALAWMASILFVIFMLFLSAVIYLQFRGLFFKITAYSLLALLIVSAGMTTYKYRTEYLTKKGVLVAEEARVYSAPTDDSDLEFIGAFGLTFEIDKAEDGYYLVVFENKRKGWIQKVNVEII